MILSVFFILSLYNFSKTISNNQICLLLKPHKWWTRWKLFCSLQWDNRNAMMAEKSHTLMSHNLSFTAALNTEFRSLCIFDGGKLWRAGPSHVWANLLYDQSQVKLLCSLWKWKVASASHHRKINAVTWLWLLPSFIRIIKKKTSYNQLNLNEAKVHDVWMKAGRD